MKLNNKLNILTLPFKKRYVISNLKYIIKNIKPAIQRLKYGVSDVDVYELGMYLNTVIENGLKLYREEIYQNSFIMNELDHPSETAIDEIISLIVKINSEEIYNEQINTLGKLLHVQARYGKESEEYKKAKKEFDKLNNSFITEQEKDLDKIYYILAKLNDNLWI